MAAVRQHSQAAVFLLAAVLACALGLGTSSARAAVLEAGNRKLLGQGSPSSGSTVFGDPPEGTLVMTWTAVPAKHSDNPQFGGQPSPPYQYDWFNLFPLSCPGCANLAFYVADAYVAGSGGQKTQLTSTGGCDYVTTEYTDEATLISSCKGAFTLPSDLAVSGVYMLLQAPYDMEFHVTTPFDGLTCIAPLFTENPFNLPLQNFDAGSFEAVFDSGDDIPLTGDALPTSPSYFTVLEFNSLPFTETGTLVFKSINMQLTYDPPAQLPQGLELHWGIPYGTCTFENALVTVHSASLDPPSFPVGGTCDPYSTTPNQCFNAGGDAFVCCPGQCAANPGQTPACEQPLSTAPGTFPAGTCDPYSDTPNQCFNADGSCYICCPGQCQSDSPSCA